MTPRSVLTCAVLLSGVGSLLSFGALAHAQTLDCVDPFFQRDMNACAAQSLEKADAALDAVYQAALIRMKAQDEDLKDVDARLVGAEDALRRAQAAWIAYREAHCAVMAVPSRGGSMEPMVVSSCKADLSDARTRDLQDMLDSLGG